MLVEQLTGWQSLFYKEVRRFLTVGFQTLMAPLVTALLYMLIFGHTLGDAVKVYDSYSYVAFLIPGLVMMSVLQNAFANSSSSLIQSKIMGNLTFILLSPLSPMSWFAAYVGASVVRGLLVGAGVLLVTIWFTDMPFAHPLWAVFFAAAGAIMLGSLGLLAGLWSEKFDQIAAFQSFAIVPMTFLSGVFYSIHSLPPFWQQVSRLNPFLYIIDGFRYGFFGQSDINPWTSCAVVLISTLCISAAGFYLLKTGYKIRT